MKAYTDWAAQIREAIKSGCALDPEWLEKTCYAIQRDAVDSRARDIERDCDHLEEQARQNGTESRLHVFNIAGRRAAARSLRGPIIPLTSEVCRAKASGEEGQHERRR